jgi:putative NADPH-quinone reductase
MKKILLINGHPDTESFNHALMDAYKRGAEKTGYTIETLAVGELAFTPNLKYGYRKRTELEPDLHNAWKSITEADHIVWFYPQWWGFMPALLKGFIDRLFLPGFAFDTVDGTYTIVKKLKGKTSRIITTTDYPVWYYKLILKEAGTQVMKKMILEFTGIKNRGTTYFGPIKDSALAFKEKCLEKAFALGVKGA